MLDTVDAGRVEMLKCRRIIRDGVITMYEERLDPLNQQLVEAMRSELDLMTQKGACGEFIPDQ